MSIKPVVHPRPARDSGPGTERAQALLRRVGERVRAARSRRGMSRKVLARDSDVSASYLARLEDGDCNISLQLLQQVADALAIPFVDLVRDNGADQVELALIGQMLRRLPQSVLPAAQAHRRWVPCLRATSGGPSSSSIARSRKTRVSRSARSSCSTGPGASGSS